LIAAVGVVAQLKDAINTIWQTKGPEGAGIWWYVRTYLISLAEILGLGFLLAVSLVVNTMLSSLSSWLSDGAESLSWQAVNFIISLANTALCFVLRWFPDGPVSWADAWRGDLATAILFNLGKLAIAWYIGSQGLESTYGAAASVVVLLIWVYYSVKIVLFGGEITHVCARQRLGASPPS
jgi:membrane protein